jgi:hypothetical protein
MTPIDRTDPIPNQDTPGGSDSQKIFDRSATPVWLAPTSITSEEETMLKKAKSKAGLILASSAELYREITISALSLVSARR